MVKLEGVLATNCPESPDTMSIMKWFWRIIEEMVMVMLLPCGLTENFSEETTLNAVDTISHAPLAKANWISRSSPLREKFKWIFEYSGPWKSYKESFGVSEVSSWSSAR